MKTQALIEEASQAVCRLFDGALKGAELADLYERCARDKAFRSQFLQLCEVEVVMYRMLGDDDSAPRSGGGSCSSCFREEG